MKGLPLDVAFIHRVAEKKSSRKLGVQRRAFSAIHTTNCPLLLRGLQDPVFVAIPA
jgi:hypothetical protein